MAGHAITAAVEQSRSICTARRPGGEVVARAATTRAPYTTELLYAAPLLALDVACRALLDETTTDPGRQVDRMLDISESARRAGQLTFAAELCEALLRASSEADGIILGDRLARVHVARAKLANDQADAKLAQLQFSQAEAALKSAALTETQRYAEILAGQAAAWRQERLPGDLDRANAALDKATQLLAAHGQTVSLTTSDVLNERTMLAYARLDLPGTVDAARAEIALYRQLGLADSTALLDALTTAGGVLSQLGRNDEAEIELREGLRLIDLHPGEQPAAALGVLNNYTALHLDRGRYDDALAMADRAVAYAQSAFGTGAARTLTPLTARGKSLSQLGRYGEARKAFEEALAVTAAHGAGLGPLRRLRLQDNLATTLIALGETASAEALIDQGLQETTAREGLDYWRGRLYRLRAALAARRDDWPAADAAAAEAIARIGAVNGEHHPVVIDSGAMRCFAQTQGRLPGRACADLAADMPKLQGAAPGYRFNAMAALAQDDDNHGRPEAALAHSLQALAAAESAATPDPLWSGYAALAEQLRARGVKQLAILLGKQSIEQIERMRDSLGADLKRHERGFLADKLIVYRRLADWLTEDDRIDEALDVIRMLKEEEFFDFANRDGGLLGRTNGGPSYADAETSLRQLWRAAPGGRVGTLEGGNAFMLQREDERVAQRLAQLRESFDQATRSAGPAAALAAVRTPPPIGEARVWIYPGHQRLHLVIDAHSRRTTTSVDVRPTDIGKRVTELLGAIERREPVLDRLQALYALVGTPLERALTDEGVKRIVLTVDGPLRYLPFAALHDGHGFVGERYSVEQRVPTPPVAAAATAQPTLLSEIHVDAMGVSRSLAGMTPLAEVANEVCGIVAGPVRGLEPEAGSCGGSGIGRGVLRGSGWMNEEFTADRLQTVIANGRQGRGGASLLHIGTHFVLRPGRMSRSWLLLGDGKPLTLGDLGRFDFQGQSLVTLSACDTGIGGAQGDGSGAEIDGLGGLMLRRGAGGVVASLWRVNDASTSRLMQAFYRELAANLAPAEALQRAQARIRSAGDRDSHPYHWAGFYLVTGGSLTLSIKRA